jgi:hypothetical protein
MYMQRETYVISLALVNSLSCLHEYLTEPKIALDMLYMVLVTSGFQTSSSPGLPIEIVLDCPASS